MINNINSLNPKISRSVTVVSQRSEVTRMAERSGSPSIDTTDTVQISKAGRDRLKASEKGTSSNLAAEDLSPEQKQEVEKLKKRDLEVKAHEKAHEAAGAGIVQGGATYQYQRGSDGRMYAVGGEVKIDTSREKDPENTIRKMQQVKKAALSPSQPSSQDRSVAAQASQIEAEARAELVKENAEETNSVQENPRMDVSSRSAGIADHPQKASSIGDRINTVA